MLRTWDIIVDELESKDEAKVGQKKAYGAKGGNCDPEPSPGWSELYIGYLADDGGNSCYGFREDVPGFSWMRYVGSCSTDSSRTLAFNHVPYGGGMGVP